VHNPSWFKNGQTLIVNARSCGINKDGHEQYIVNPETGFRSNSEIDDDLAECCDLIKYGDFSRNEVFYHPTSSIIKSDIYVPKYFDQGTLDGVRRMVGNHDYFSLKTLGQLRNEGLILVFGGHGSPSSDQRLGEIPYIKVSDLRAGHVNINPTNMVPIELAKKFWGDESSGLCAYDLISPERASKNIGEFCVLMPGQEKAVLTKEVIVVRANTDLLDQFYLLWALTLNEVVVQWERIVFMQTNREDVGRRINEIQIPIPESRELADELSFSFKEYYLGLEKARRKFVDAINDSEFNHHIHLGD
jgi:type I restriction enzyme M protein